MSHHKTATTILLCTTLLYKLEMLFWSTTHFVIFLSYTLKAI